MQQTRTPCFESDDSLSPGARASSATWSVYGVPSRKEVRLSNSKLNDWMTLTANVAVVAGIIFLGIEVQQNNELLRTQANLVLSQNLSSATELVATDERLGGLLTSGGSLAELCGYRAHGALLQVGWAAFAGVQSSRPLIVSGWRKGTRRYLRAGIGSIYNTFRV
jgi:hypothetical protein